jgi:ribonuclease HI
MEKKKKFYAVARGRNTGIFSAWFGPAGAEAQIRQYPAARYKGFPTLEEARQWLSDSAAAAGSPRPKAGATGARRAPALLPEPESGQIVIYTDGGCSYNPGPGGYGAVILQGERRRELSGGYSLTTNNRMELTACIQALKALDEPSRVLLFSDSKYVVDGITKGWAARWKKNGWMRTAAERAENYDLWDELLGLCARHTVDFVWVKGHAGTAGNECCDRLATAAAAGRNLPPDTGYEQRTKK